VAINRALAQKETDIQIKMKGERSLHRSELLLQTKKIQYLANLAYGIDWFLDQLAFLRHTDQQEDGHSKQGSNPFVEATSQELMVCFCCFWKLPKPS